MSAESASEVSGPVAMIQGEPSGSGTAVISPRVERDERVRRHRLGDHRRETDTIDRKGAAGGHARGVGAAHDDRAEPAHFFLEQPDGVLERVAAERVAADELGEMVGLVDERRPHGPHLVQRRPGRRARPPARRLRSPRDRRR